MAGEKKRILIAEDYKLLREGLKALLHSGTDFEVVAEAENGLEALRYARKHLPDLILLDLSMPRMDGLSVIKEMKRQCPEMKILALTIHESDQYVLEAFDAGADGYCLKDAGRDELLVAIDSVLSGRTYVSPSIADYVMEGFLTDRKRLKSQTSWDGVTQREREVLKLLGEGHPNKEIADMLDISVRTVEKHRANIMKKLNLHNAAALTAYAIEKGLVARKI